LSWKQFIKDFQQFPENYQFVGFLSLLTVATYLQGLESDERDGIRPPKDILMFFLFNEGGRSSRGFGFMSQES
jgi:hypothetical protein